jgi:hypothetical protein
MTPVPRREQDASLLLRRVYEHVVCFAWIAIDPAVNAKRWVAYDYRYRLATDLELQRFGKPGLDPAQRASFEAFRQAHQDMPSLEQRAREADAYWLPKLAQHSDGRSDAERAFSLVDEYTTIYRPTSANTHPSPRSLFDYVNPGFATGRFRIGFIPTLREGDRFAYTFAPLTFATMLFNSEQVLGYPKSDDIFAAFHDAAATTYQQERCTVTMTGDYFVDYDDETNTTTVTAFRDERSVSLHVRPFLDSSQQVTGHDASIVLGVFMPSVARRRAGHTGILAGDTQERVVNEAKVEDLIAALEWLVGKKQ